MCTRVIDLSGPCGAWPDFMAVFVNNMQDRLPAGDGLISLIKKVVERGLEIEGLKRRSTEVSVALVDDAYIQELNRRFRGIDRPTDVLSFPMEEPSMLGDIVISLERAGAQAKEYGHSFEREVAYLVVHGLLHLLGYDHVDEVGNSKMRDCEEDILESLGLGIVG